MKTNADARAPVVTGRPGSLGMERYRRVWRAAHDSETVDKFILTVDNATGLSHNCSIELIVSQLSSVPLLDVEGASVPLLDVEGA